MRYTSGLPNSLELYEIDLPYGEGGNSSLRKGPSSRSSHGLRRRITSPVRVGRVASRALRSRIFPPRTTV